MTTSSMKWNGGKPLYYITNGEDILTQDLKAGTLKPKSNKGKRNGK